LSAHYAFSLSTAQLLAIAVIVLLTWTNSCGLAYGKIVQNLFTTAKTVALLALIVLGLAVVRSADAVAQNFADLWTPRGYSPIAAGLDATTPFGLFVAICVTQTESLFAADSWHDITFAADEVRNPERTLPLALALGSVIVVVLYFLANLAYLLALPLADIQHAPLDRVATAMLQAIFPTVGAVVVALASTVRRLSSTPFCKGTAPRWG
jgi:APA family basic amino acid/polyamine antiporter